VNLSFAHRVCIVVLLSIVSIPPRTWPLHCLQDREHSGPRYVPERSPYNAHQWPGRFAWASSRSSFLADCRFSLSPRRPAPSEFFLGYRCIYERDH
jgi:hypothetical protein